MEDARVLDGEQRAWPSTCRQQYVATNMPSIGIRAIKRLRKPAALVVAVDGAGDDLLHQGGAKPSAECRVRRRLTCVARRDHHSPPCTLQPRCRRKVDRFSQTACPQNK